VRVLPLSLLVATTAQGQPGSTPYTLDLGLTIAGTATRNDPDTTLDLTTDGTEWDVDGLLRPRERQRYPSMALRLGAEAQPTPGLLLRGLVDTGEIRPGRTLDPPEDGPTSQGLPLDEAAGEGLFLREAVIGFVGQSASIELGRRRSEVAGGLVWADSGTGAAAEVDLVDLRGGPLRLEAQAVLVGRLFSDLEAGSTLAALRVDIPVSWFEGIAPFVALWSDRGGAVADILASAATETVIVDNGAAVAQSLLDGLASATQPRRARLLYLGADGTLLPLTGMSLRGTGVAQVGEATMQISSSDATTPNDPTTFRLRGWAAALEAHKGLGQRWDVGALGFALSGDRGPRIDRVESGYASFIAPAPYWDWSGLFFSGGLSQGFYPSRASAAGINGHGVAGVGPIVSWQGNRPSVEWRAVWLRAIADAPPPPLGGGGATYGVEIDLRADWPVADTITLAGEVDVLIPGTYFPQDDPALRIIALLDLHNAP